jgi:hypothetical protein
LVEPRLRESSVVEQRELPGQRGWIGNAERRGQLGQLFEQPAADVARDVGCGTVKRGFGGRVGERAAAEPWLGDGRGEHVEDSEQPPPRVVMTLDLGQQARASRFVTCLEIGANKTVLAPEGAVQAGFRDTGALDDLVDADGVHAVLVEELAGGGQQPVTR